MEFNCENPAQTLDKTTFSRVFRKAYLATVKPATIINAFRSSGIYPTNRHEIDERKLQPSHVHEGGQDTTMILKDRLVGDITRGTRSLFCLSFLHVV